MIKNKYGSRSKLLRIQENISIYTLDLFMKNYYIYLFIFLPFFILYLSSSSHPIPQLSLSNWQRFVEKERLTSHNMMIQFRCDIIKWSYDNSSSKSPVGSGGSISSSHCQPLRMTKVKAPPAPNKDTATWGKGRENVAVVMAVAAVKMAL